MINYKNNFFKLITYRYIRKEKFSNLIKKFLKIFPNTIIFIVLFILLIINTLILLVIITQNDTKNKIYISSLFFIVRYTNIKFQTSR